MNLEYTIYDLNTGVISRIVNVPDEEHAVLQVQPGEASVPGSYHPGEFRVVNGRLVRYTEEQTAAYRNPQPGRTWNPQRGMWEDLRTRAELDEAMRARIMESIRAIEERQPRAIREAILTGSTAFLEKLDSDITNLRKQLP